VNLYKKQKGFSLIEILITLSIASVALLGLIRSQSQSVDSLIYFKQKIIAELVASNIAVEKKIINPESSTDKGTYKMGDKDWHWSTDTKKTDNTNILKVTLNVFASKQDMNKKQSSARVILYIANED
jgi:general secretion pathway protein I